MFTRKKKKLTLEKMHALYLILKDTLPAKDEALLIDQVNRMLDRMTPEMYMEAMKIMYEKIPDTNNQIKIALMFISGLKDNHFFEYVSFIRGFGGKQQRTD